MGVGVGVGGCLPIGTNIGSKVQGQRGVCVWLYVDRHLGSKGVGVGGGGEEDERNVCRKSASIFRLCVGICRPRWVCFSCKCM